MRRAERGFSLVETIISVGVLAVAIVALTHLITTASRTNALAHQRMMAALLAQQKIESLRGELLLDEAPRSIEHLDAEGAVLCRGDGGCAGAVYLREWSVRASPVAPAAVLVHVQARHARQGGGEVHLITVRPRVAR